MALTVHGVLSYRELSVITGSSVRQIRRVVSKMVELRVVDVDAGHRVRLREDVDWDRVSEDGGTAGTRDRRHERNEQARRRCLRPGPGSMTEGAVMAATRASPPDARQRSRSTPIPRIHAPGAKPQAPVGGE